MPDATFGFHQDAKPQPTLHEIMQSTGEKRASRAVIEDVLSKRQRRT